MDFFHMYYMYVLFVLVIPLIDKKKFCVIVVNLLSEKDTLLMAKYK